MKRTTSLIAIMSLFLVLAAGCSKEKKVENKLSRKDGRWSIDKLNIKTYEDGYYYYDSHGYTNCGTFVFDDNGSVTITTNLDGNTEVQTGSWLNDERNITITIDGTSQKYFIKEINRKELNVTYKYDYYIDGYFYTDEYTFEMSFDK